MPLKILLQSEPLRVPLLVSCRCQFGRQFKYLRFTHSTPTNPLELSYPASTTSSHHDLPSFLEYALRVGLDPKSSTYVGTRYEYTVQSSLKRLGISLKRVGGRSDYGIDLMGTWDLPAVPLHLKALIQCKAHATKPSPSEVRELEGALMGAPMGWRDPGVIGLLIAQREATKGVRDALGKSRRPMGFALCSDKGKILQFLWNKRAEEEGLLGVGVGIRYGLTDRNDKEVLLIWKGEALVGVG